MNGSTQTTGKWPRILLAGPLVLLTAFAVTCGAALWLPAGPAMIDNIAIPLVLFPGIWAALFFYAYLDSRLMRAYALISLLLLINTAAIARHMLS